MAQAFPDLETNQHLSSYFPFRYREAAKEHRQIMQVRWWIMAFQLNEWLLAWVASRHMAY
jgi:hypothetical protein